MITIWNHGATAEDLLLTLHYASGSYKLPIHLASQASQMLNFSDILNRKKPDADGNLIPEGVEQGSATLSGSLGNTQAINASISVASFDPSHATCTVHCFQCGGWESRLLIALPSDILAGNTASGSSYAQYSDGTLSDFTGLVNWSSGNTQVATVATGSPSPGLVTAVAAGATTISAITQTTYGLAIVLCSYANPCSAGAPYVPTLLSGTADVVTQIPTASRIVPPDPTNGRSPTCPMNQPNCCPSGQTGWLRIITKSVTDQQSPPQDIVALGQLLTEVVTVSSPNDFGIPQGSITTGSGYTNGLGQYSDTLLLCSAACPGSSGTSALTQATTDSYAGIAYNLALNTLAYTCNSATVNGQ